MRSLPNPAHGAVLLIILSAIVLIVGFYREEHTRHVAKLPGGWAEVDSLYVWARDKQ